MVKNYEDTIQELNTLLEQLILDENPNSLPLLEFLASLSPRYSDYNPSLYYWAAVRSSTFTSPDDTLVRDLRECLTLDELYVYINISPYFRKD